MKKKFNRKKTLFSLAFGFVFSLICGFGLSSVTEAKALNSSYNIADYAWANYFDASRLINTSASVDSDNSVKYSVMNTSDEAVNEILVARDVFGSDGIFRYMEDDIVYTLNYDFELTGFEDTSWDGGFGLVLRNSSTGEDLDYWGHYYNAYLISFIVSSSPIDLYVNYGNRNHITTYPIPAGASITFSHLAIYRGTSIKYEYTPFFYDLDSIPNPPPTIEGSGSGDSGSGDSGSGDSGSGDSGSGDSGSDSPDVPDVSDDGNYQEGYLAGLSQAQYGILGQATFELNLFTSSTETYTISPTLIYGGVDFTNIYEDYKSNYPDISLGYLRISFSNPVPASSLLFRGTGAQDWFTRTNSSTGVAYASFWDLLYGVNILSPKLYWRSVGSPASYDFVYESYLSDSSSVLVTSIKTLPFSDIEDLNGFQLVMADNQYLAGYENGINSIDEQSYSKGYNAGYSSGYNIGKDEGYTEGFSQGTSSDPYGFTDFMFSALDMPGRIIYNWLNFEFLGMNLAGLVATIITLIIVAYVIKLRI